MFVRQLSPLARLLDWLAVKYNIVIVVSGGNVDSRPTLDFDEASDGQRLLHLGAESDNRERQSAAVRSLHDQARHRRLLSPAEAVNVVSVGSVHADGLHFEPSDAVLDVMAPGLPAGYSPVGFGYSRSIKPEVRLPGGRQVFSAPLPGESGPTQLEPVPTPTLGPGLRAATPGRAGETEAFGYSCGTSNSTALATRILSQVFGVLEGLEHNHDQFPFPDAQYHPVLAKTLLVHAARWDDAGPRLKDLLGPHMNRRELTRVLGYGIVDSEKATSAKSTRVVLLGAASINENQRNTFRFPLPSALSASTEWRRLTIALGWLSPVNVRSHKYRMARLRFTPSKDDIGVEATEAEHHAVRKGTVQHEVFEGSKATGFVAGSALSIDIDCDIDAGKLQAPIRYALAASLEVGPTIRADIHNEVSTRLRTQAREQTRTHAMGVSSSAS